MVPIQKGDGKPRLLPGKRTYPQGSAGSDGKPRQGLPGQAHRKDIPAVLPCRPPCRWIDGDLPRIHEMECTSQGLDDGFLDRPEQGRCLFQISARQLQGMLKLLWMEDPVKRVFSVEFIAPCRIDADIGLISAESGPEVSSILAEGDGRPTMFSQEEMGPAKQASDHLNGESSPVGSLTAIPERTFHRRKVIPQDADEAVPVPCPVRPIPSEGFGGKGHGCIEDGAPSMNGTRGMDGYFVVILCHIHSDLF